MWSRKSQGPTQDQICVSSRVQHRVDVVALPTIPMTIEGLMAQIGATVTHQKPGSPEFEEAITSAEAVLALLHRMQAGQHDFRP